MRLYTLIGILLLTGGFAVAQVVMGPAMEYSDSPFGGPTADLLGSDLTDSTDHIVGIVDGDDLMCKDTDGSGWIYTDRGAFGVERASNIAATDGHLFGMSSYEFGGVAPNGSDMYIAPGMGAAYITITGAGAACAAPDAFTLTVDTVAQPALTYGTEFCAGACATNAAIATDLAIAFNVQAIALGNGIVATALGDVVGAKRDLTAISAINIVTGASDVACGMPTNGTTGNTYVDGRNVIVTNSGATTLSVGPTLITAGVPVAHSAGSAAAPSAYFGADTNTGFYYYGSDSVGFSANGTAIMSMNTKGIQGHRMTTDVAVTPMELVTSTPYPVATVNFSSANLYIGSTYPSRLDMFGTWGGTNTCNAGDTVPIRKDSATLVTLTYGTDWCTVGVCTSIPTAAASLSAAIDAITGVYSITDGVRVGVAREMASTITNYEAIVNGNPSDVTCVARVLGTQGSTFAVGTAFAPSNSNATSLGIATTNVWSNVYSNAFTGGSVSGTAGTFTTGLNSTGGNTFLGATYINSSGVLMSTTAATGNGGGYKFGILEGGPLWTRNDATEVVKANAVRNAATPNQIPVTYLNGYDVVDSPGHGQRIIKIDDYTACAGKVLTITVDGTATPRTEGVNWTAATNNDTTAASLEVGVEAVTGISSVVGTGATSSTVGLSSDDYKLYHRVSVVETGVDGCLTVTSGTDGSLKYYGDMLYYPTNTYNIGAAAANKPANVYIANLLESPSVVATTESNSPLFKVIAGKGGYGSTLYKTETLTCAGGGGSATLSTAADFIPDGAFLKGFSSRVISAGLTGPATMDIGISGGDTDLFGAALSVADNAVSANAQATAAWANPFLADSVVLVTMNGANCTAGQVYLTIYYEIFTAPLTD